MDKEIKLKKIKVVGEKFFHCFQMDDGTKIEAETTGEDYLQLGGQNPLNPTIDGGRWVHSYSRRKVDSVSGDLEENQYFEDGGSFVAKLKDGSEHIKTSLAEIETENSKVDSSKKVVSEIMKVNYEKLK